MLLAAFFFSVMAVMVKASGSHLPPQEIILARSIITFLLTAYLIRRENLSFWGNNKKLLMVRGFFGFLGLSSFYYTLTHIPIADSTMLQYTNPLFTALLAGFILKERSSKKQWIYFLIAFCGVLLIIRPGFSLNAFHATIGLGGAFFAAVAYTIIRKLRLTDHPYHVILYLPVFGAILSFPIVFKNFVMPQGWDWLMLLGVGISTQIAQVFLTKGLHYETAAKATNVTYSNILFSTFFGFIFWGEIPDWRTICGAVVVILAIFQISRKRYLE